AGPNGDPVVEAQRNAAANALQLVLDQMNLLTVGSTQGSGSLDLVQATSAEAQSSGGLQPPTSRVARMILAGILGLIAGIVLVLLLDRFDSRIRTREDAEKAFDAPVLAEVPFIPSMKRGSKLLRAATEPRSHTADAFR